MNAHQFANGLLVVGLTTTFGYCWAGCVRLARRVGN